MEIETRSETKEIKVYLPELDVYVVVKENMIDFIGVNGPVELSELKSGTVWRYTKR